MEIKTLKQFQYEMTLLATEYGCLPKSVNLLAVSKTRTAAEIEKLADQGQSAFGENYLQEAMDKIEALRQRELEWHFIGKIQANKTKLIATNFDWVHTVERIKVAQRLSDQRPVELSPLKICLQVNTSGEASKGGVEIEALPALARNVMQLPGIELRGLMTLPAPENSFEQQRLPFRELRNALLSLKKELKELPSGETKQQGLNLDTLSMGTSNDYAAAIAEGATFIRVGTALFGPRKP